MALQRFNSLITVVFLLANIQGLVSLTSEQKQKCIEEFLEWCKKNEYYSEEEEDSGGFSLYGTSIRGQNVRIYCTVDYEGTDCLMDKKPWYHCFPNNSLTYKDQLLHSSSEVDDDICIAKYRAYISGNHAKFNSTAFNIRMGRFHQRMGRFHQHMDRFKKNLNQRMQNMRKRLSQQFTYRGRYNDDSDEDYDSDEDSDYEDSYSDYYDSNEYD